jgi:hypothetical protein
MADTNIIHTLNESISISIICNVHFWYYLFHNFPSRYGTFHFEGHNLTKMMNKMPSLLRMGEGIF